MKNILKPTLCLLFAVLFCTGNAYADEWVKYNASDGSSRGTMIRHYRDKTDVVCVHTDYTPYFLRIDGSTTICHALNVDMDTVCEFEIYNDTVYFCGIRCSTGKAAYGYFDVASLASSANTPVYYVDMPWMESATRLEVDWFASRKHVVVIGTELKGGAMMVDAIDEGLYWNVNYSNVYNDSLQLTDLAITASYVIVTSVIDRVLGNGPGILWYFDKPLMSGYSVFPATPAKYHEFSGTYFGMFLVRRQQDDDFVTINSYWKSPVEATPFSITKYNGINFNKRYDIFENGTNCTYGPIVKDFMPDDLSDVVDVLITKRVAFTGIDQSIVYEVPMSASTTPLTIVGHEYDNVRCTSLDNTHDAHHFVMSGTQKYPKNPFFLKYQNGTFGGCLTYYENYAKKEDGSNGLVECRASRFFINIVAATRMEERKEMLVETKCFSSTSTREEE